ncbi:PLP-dependent aminotransferase family protein [Fructobacillus durionis]|uniref:Aromatic amino acid aminotransferase apoenzyme n=1 Tax=Fructobacillus durionis TaxID=283737 RepID=A0A1I1GC23_9LACO|nr:PLP-dependent aminotransferase family protein [Fructobacillus durionis]SFC07418.1 aromatic amino acid aminotransferase apoenzyme [Fructobacillus durionis]
MTFKYSTHLPNTENDTLGAILDAAANPEVISLAGGLPAAELFPVEDFRASANRVFDKQGAAALQYGEAAGLPALRNEVAKNFLKPRQIEGGVKNIAISTGSEQAIEQIAKMFIDEGDTVFVEAPTYLCTVDVFRSFGAKIVTVPMDEDGMRMDALEEALKAHPEVKLIYTIPTFQNPTGRTMPVERRKQFVELAEKYDVPVLEDDPYGAIRYSGEAVPPLKAFDKTGNVIYMSSFSKILAPGFRLGFVVASEDFIVNFTLMKQMADLHSDNFSQYLVADYLKHNDVNKHIEKISALYKHRFELMQSLIESEFPAGVKHSNPEGGMFIWCQVPGDIDTMALFNECAKQGVAFVPGEPFYAGDSESGTMRLNFSNVDDDTIREGMKRLGAAIKKFLDK